MTPMLAAFLIRTFLVTNVNALRAALVAAGPPTYTVILFKNNPVLNDRNVIGDFVQPTGSWYAAGTLLDVAAYEDPANRNLHLTMTPPTFTYSGTDTAETITGYAVVDNTGAVFCSAMLATPIPMGTSLDKVAPQPFDLVFPPVHG
jgi:hypothetical protein